MEIPKFEFEYLEKVREIEFLNISYSLMENIHKAMHRAVLLNPYLKQPICIVITGSYRAGKTHTVEEFKKYYPPDDSGDVVKRPVIYVVVPERATLIALLIAILAALGDPDPTAGDIHKKKQRLRKLLRDCGTQMIILDEANHIYDRDNEKIRHEVTNFLKIIIKGEPDPDNVQDMNKYHPVSCVLCGLPYTTEILKVNLQLGSLFPDAFFIGAFSWERGKEESGIAYRNFLKKFEDELPLKIKDKLSNENLAWRCYVGTHGKLGYTAQLLRKAGQLALEKPESALDQDILARAFTMTLSSERLNISNPFVGDLPKDAGVPERDYEPAVDERRQKKGKGKKAK